MERNEERPSDGNKIWKSLLVDFNYESRDISRLSIISGQFECDQVWNVKSNAISSNHSVSEVHDGAFADVSWYNFRPANFVSFFGGGGSGEPCGSAIGEDVHSFGRGWILWISVLMYLFIFIYLIKMRCIIKMILISFSADVLDNYVHKYVLVLLCGAWKTNVATGITYGLGKL